MAGGAGRKPRGILFDKDGTLFDYHGTWGPILVEAAEMAARERRDLVPEMLSVIGFDPATARVAAGSIAGAGDTFGLVDAWITIAGGWERAALIAALDGLFIRLAPERSLPVTDLPVFFRGLKDREIRTGIATNDVAESARATILRFGLETYIEFSAGYDSGHGQKPGPGMALAFCAAVGLAPHEIAVVGDNSHDLEMGRRAGAALNIGVLTGTSGRDDLAPLADHVIGSIAELPALLDELGG
ncbi:HAD-superfamily hydrolase, subfamily IA, variant 1 [Parvibaculum lavamentivorans DS-1]|uniref:phosphoglycolate phosphatase n=1 Tax=Parvibaculum lavamentivorans (strain DS-1 / DSM 13023 / NCIMB 13966) TaxID=402881 RepID=A7HWK1_PARL1|nr:HAD family hydrolase [Parvibaculum lavamentivorans]ABS64284.1 HAD-superfamily hydrolase, subfamily IA, variant 1 [Parvibaculum lavamentivorans DS-1]